MNFGQNIWIWISGNLQPLVLVGIAVLGLYLLIERKFSKLIGLLVIVIIVVGFVYDTSGVKDFLLNLYKQIFSS